MPAGGVLITSARLIGREMLVLHGFWNTQRGLTLWAEDSTRAVKSASQAVRSARPHPFAVLPPQGASGHQGDAILALPSLLSAPLDSPEMVRATPRPASRKPPMLSAWRVPVLTVTPAAALDLLTASVDDTAGLAAEPDSYTELESFCDTESDTDIRHGASLAHLAQVAVFAQELAERGRVVPALAAIDDDTDRDGDTRPGDDGDAYRAYWRPVLQGPDVVAFDALVAAMPPVGRAEAASAADLTGQDPAALVASALESLVDAAVRRRLAAAGSSVWDRTPRRGRRPARTPAAEAWLDALTDASDGRFRLDAKSAAALTRDLAPWAQFGAQTRGPARATFRLSEIAPDDAPASSADPSPSAASWRVEFLLQSVEDPSLLVPAGQVWSGGEGLQRWIQRPDELLLTELGRASSVYPPIAGSLRQAAPAALELDAEGVHDFLLEGAGLLDQAGFGVLLPSWWSIRRRIGLKGSATPQEQGGVSEGMFTREALCDFRWRLAIGDDTLTDEEMAALAAAKSPLVQLRGEWVLIDPEQIRRGIDFIQQRDAGGAQGGARTAAEIIRLAATHPDDLDTPLPVAAVQVDGWLGELLDGTAEQMLRPVDPPESFTATLRPYQRRGLAWLAFLADLGLGACLADDMGLGKTVQLLALESVLRERGDDAGPTLLLCPMSLVGNWQREAAKFAPSLRIYAHHGRERADGDELAARLAESDLVLTTYQTAARDIEQLEAYDWARVVLDEAQAVKNSHARAAKAVRRLKAGHRIALTGTPVENKLAELWSIIDFLNPGLLGSPESFRARYAKPIEQHGHSDTAERLRRVTRPYILRRLKTDTSIIDDLPEKIELKQYCTLTTEQASLYQSVVTDMMEKIENSAGIERRGNVLAAMTKLKQVCNHPAQLLHDGSGIGQRSGKVARLHELLDEIIAAGDKVLLFTQYTEFAEMLMPHLAARFEQDVLFLHGQSSRARRDEMVRRFQEDPDGPSIFLLSLKAGGTGLTLTAASHVIHLDRWWNPAVENQATDRAFRIGQRRNVEVHKFICTGTMEERIDEMIERKKELANLVVNDGEGWLTELSTGELRDLFALSKEAVGEQ